METPAGSGGQTTTGADARMSGSAGETLAGEWTEALASDFLAGSDLAARRVARMGHPLRRFQRERGLALPRPVAANSPQQSYFADPSSPRWRSPGCSMRGWGSRRPTARFAPGGLLP